MSLADSPAVLDPPAAGAAPRRVPPGDAPGSGGAGPSGPGEPGDGAGDDVRVKTDDPPGSGDPDPADGGRLDRVEKTRARRLIDAGVAVLFVAAGVGALVVLLSLKEPAQPVDRVTPPPLVEVAEVVADAGGVTLDSDGVAVPYREIAVSAEVSGRVVEMSEDCRSGHYVPAGQVLLRIDPQTYELERKRLEAEVRSAQSSLDELDVQVRNAKATAKIALADYELARNETARQEDLRRTGGGGTVTAVEQARRNENQAKDKLQTAANQARALESQRDRLSVQKELAETNLERAELDLERTAVAAPTGGVIVSTNVERDGYVRAGDPLFTIEDTSKAEVKTNLRPKTLAWVLAHPPPGTAPNPEAADAGAYALPSIPVTVEYALLGNTYTWDGVLSRAEGAGFDERTRTVPVRVTVDDPRAVSRRGGDRAAGELPVAGPRALTRGMYVTVALHTDPDDPLLQLPEVALRPGNRVWAVRDGKLEVLTVPVAAIVDGAVLVPPGGGGLRAGDRLVTTPLPAAVPGMKVRIAGEGGAEGGAEGGGAEGGSETPPPNVEVS